MSHVRLHDWPRNPFMISSILSITLVRNKHTAAMKSRSLIFATLFATTSALAGPLGTGGVEHTKYISDAGNNGKFYSVKCKKGRAWEVLYEPSDGHRWFLVPPAEPLAFFVGPSPEKFSAAACADQTSARSHSAVSVEGGIGSTASGIKSYKITCSNQIMYQLQNTLDGDWYTLDGNATFGQYKGLRPRAFAERFCRDR